MHNSSLKSLEDAIEFNYKDITKIFSNILRLDHTDILPPAALRLFYQN